MFWGALNWAGMQVVEMGAEMVKGAVSVIESELERHQQPFILGPDFSAADIALIHGLRNAQVTEHPELYIAKLLHNLVHKGGDRPAYIMQCIQYTGLLPLCSDISFAPLSCIACIYADLLLQHCKNVHMYWMCTSRHDHSFCWFHGLDQQ